MLIVSTLVLLPVLEPGVQGDLQPAQLQQDFDLLKSALEEAHGGLYRFSAKAELDRHFDRARAKLDRPMPTLQFIGIVSEALTGVRDGHMRLEYDAVTNAALATARLLPLRVASEAGRVVVSHNDSTDVRIQPGMELLSVNGHPIADVTKTILTKLSGDGFIETGKAWRMVRNFAQNYWLFVDQKASFVVTARATGGRPVTATLDGVTPAIRPAPTSPAVSLVFPRDGIGVLRIRTFDGDSFTTSLTAVFAELREKRASALILDLRGNGGGVDQYGALLVSHFVSAPFRYFEHIKVTTVHPSFATWKATTFEELKKGTRPAPGGGFFVLPQLHPGVAEQRPSETPFPGRVFVLIDGGTFSTAADVCAQLRSLTKATFVGEETGGAAEGNTSGLNAQIVLPQSGLKLKIQMYGYWNAVHGSQHGRGTLPDVAVVQKVDDTLRGTDAALDRAITFASQTARY